MSPLEILELKAQEFAENSPVPPNLVLVNLGFFKVLAKELPQRGGPSVDGMPYDEIDLSVFTSCGVVKVMICPHLKTPPCLFSYAYAIPVSISQAQPNKVRSGSDEFYEELERT